jgi:hypothetical protein
MPDLEMDTPIDIELMSRALSYLNGLPSSSQSPEYKKIVESIHNYLNNNCQHKLVEDLIDTAPESSTKIVYCEKCMQTFA